MFPDRVIVWNETQAREARELHAVPPERVVVTGAQPFDRWFDRRPNLARDEFCARVGLPADLPFVLFVGSTAGISRPDDEETFVRSWIAAVRSSGEPALRDASILIRPHPYNPGSWATADLTDLGNVAVWPRRGANPVDENDRHDYFDSMYHSAAVVGINTSAMIESAIIGRPVHTIQTEDFAKTQGGTLHFHYMLPENGGFLRVATSLEEHAAQLADCLTDGDIAAEQLRRFVGAFLRPHGLERGCTPILADELESLAMERGGRPVRVPRALLPVTALLYAGAIRRRYRSDGKLPRDAMIAARRTSRALARTELRLAGDTVGARLARKSLIAARLLSTSVELRASRRYRAIVPKIARPPHGRRRGHRARARPGDEDRDDAMSATAEQDLQQRLAELSAGAAYRAYLDARERVLALMDGAGGGAPSAYWREELGGFDYMLDASPLIVDKLRQHCYHITGLRAYDYRTGKDKAEQRLREKLDRLLELGGEELFVPEPPLLGGFGFPHGDGLFNVDTLKFYEAVIALQRGGVLGDLRGADERPIVWEIGAGWGGMAYTLKTLCPGVTYVITDLPQLFLFSAVYLRTAFPGAKVAFHGDGPIEELLAGEPDFVFSPHTALAELELPRLDLTVNMVSFQEMTTAQVEGYVEHAYAQGSRYLYSLNRDRSYYNPELSNVSEIVNRRFWPHEIPVLDVGYTKVKAPKPTKGAKVRKAGAALKAKAVKGEGSDLRMDYRHVIGWRRADP